MGPSKCSFYEDKLPQESTGYLNVLSKFQKRSLQNLQGRGCLSTVRKLLIAAGVVKPRVQVE